ncbi:MAG: hypothetical protein ABUL44_03250, partial [Flavobacterium sp.]
MNEQPTRKIPGLFPLALSCIAFVVLYLILSYYNRLAADDYFYLDKAEHLGVWNGMLASYHTWVTRWFSILFLNGVLFSTIHFHSLLPYHVFTLLVLIAVVFRLIRVVLEKFRIPRLNLATLLLYSMLVVASLFFFSFSISEVWFWTAATTMYLWSLIFLMIGIA